MVAIALSTILIGVLAATFTTVTRAYEESLDRVEEARVVNATYGVLEADWAAAVAVPWLDFFVATQSAVNHPDLGSLRRDELRVLVLDTEPKPKLYWVTYKVQPNSASQGEAGRLVRERTPALKTSLQATYASLGWDPAVDGTPPTKTSMLCDRVARFRVRVFVDGKYLEPEAPPGSSAAYVYRGNDARIEGFELKTPNVELVQLTPGSLIRLQDASGSARFDEGLYALRMREAAESSPRVGRVLLQTPPGDAAGQVQYQAAWLPSAIHVMVEFQGQRSNRRFDRVLHHRTTRNELLQESTP